MVQMFSGKVPWSGITGTAVSMKVQRGERPKRSDCNRCLGVEMPDEVWTLLDKCWAHEIARRPGMHDIQEKMTRLREAHDQQVINNIEIDDPLPEEAPSAPVRDNTPPPPLNPTLDSLFDSPPLPPASGRVLVPRRSRLHLGPLAGKPSRLSSVKRDVTYHNSEAK
jgi:hypothetical protein